MNLQFDNDEFLGNTQEIFNQNFQEFNTHTCNLLYSATNLWNDFRTDFAQLSSPMVAAFNAVSTTSAFWKSSSDLVSNLQKYWLQPIMIVYPDSFDMVVDVETVQTKLNSQINYSIDPTNYYDEQLLRVECMVRNFNPTFLDNTIAYSDLYRLNQNNLSAVNIDQILSEQNRIATSKNTTVNNLTDYMSYKNKINSLIPYANAVLKKNVTQSVKIENIDELRGLSNSIEFDKIFYSTELINFSQRDLSQLYCLFDQFKLIDIKYRPLAVIGDTLTTNEIMYFDGKNIFNSIVHALYFKKVNNRWVYWPDKFIDICRNLSCKPCNDIIDINAQYGDRSCPGRALFSLTPCVGDELVPVPSSNDLITGNQRFAEHVGFFVDLRRGDVIIKYYVNSLQGSSLNYPSSSFLLPGTYELLQQSAYQTCSDFPVYDMGPLNISPPQIVDILSELFA